MVSHWSQSAAKKTLASPYPTRTPAFWGYPPPPHDYQYHWVILDPKSRDDKVKVTNFKNSPKFQIFEFWNWQYTLHTFWTCLIRCANIKWIRWVLLKIQSGHDSVHRRTDGQGDTSIPRYQLRLSGGYNDLTPRNHTMFIVSKANQRVGLIKRCFTHLKFDLIDRLFKAFVRPILVYGSPMWSSALLCDINGLERVQKTVIMWPQTWQMCVAPGGNPQL